MTERSIVYMPVEELPSAVRNPKKHSEEIVGSVSRFGFVEPMTLDERTGRLVSGHGRRDELLRRQASGEDPPDGIQVGDDGRWLAPVTRGWSSRSDAEAEAFVIAANRIGEAGGWHDDMLADVLADLAKLDGGLTGIGYADDDLSEILERLGRDVDVSAHQRHVGDPDDVPEPPAAPRTQRGDVWLLGTHRIVCGDCSDAATVASLMRGERAVLMATDPPYQIGYDAQNHPPSNANRGSENRNKEWTAYHETTEADALYETFMAVAIAEAITHGAPIYQWHAGTRSCAVLDAWEKNGVLVHQQIIWTKARKVLTYADFMQQHEPCFYGWQRGQRPPVERRPPVNEPTVWDHDQRGETGAGHPTQKPSILYVKPIEWHTQPGELIYEPFSGSGTAIAAAEMTGRRCCAVELAPEFVDVACIRFQKLTGVVPVLERTGEPHDFLAGR